MCVRYRFMRYTRQRRERFGTRFCVDWSFLVTADRQTDRHICNYQNRDSVLQTENNQSNRSSYLGPKRYLVLVHTAFPSFADTPMVYAWCLKGGAQSRTDYRSGPPFYDLPVDRSIS